MMRALKDSGWYSFWVCSHCGERKSYDESNSSHTCRGCGNIVGGTHQDTTRITLKRYKYVPWWMFWRKQIQRFVGLNDESIKWMYEDVK